jgi:hypothetical protein
MARSSLTLVLSLALALVLAGCGSSGGGEADTPAETGEVAEEASACPDGQACDDGDPCTQSDVCAAGVCAGTAYTCDDGLDCTDDACDGQGGCTNALQAGWCLAERGPNAAEADPLQELCLEDGALHPDNSCLGCDAISPDAWTPRDAAACDDGSGCTIDDRCDDQGSCHGDPRDCDDGNDCTFDSCDEAGGCQHDNVTIACEDGDGCTGPDFCKDGQCKSGPPLTCGDDSECTLDSCEPAKGCTFVLNPGVACDDGNPCTADSCSEDGNTCLHEALDQVQCSDHDVCTTGDMCVAGTCTSSGTLACPDDGNPCTTDACDAFQGCVHAFDNGQACDDGFTCSIDDVCVFGVCQGNDLYCLSECVYTFTGDVHNATSVLMGTDGKPGNSLDVDGNPDTCAPSGKCSDGIDNALGVLNGFMNPTLEQAMGLGQWMMLAELIEPTLDGTPFTLNMMFGLLDQDNGPAAPCDPTDPACVYYVLTNNFGPECLPKIALTNAKIVGTSITAGGKEFVFPLYLTFEGGAIVQLTVLWARLQGNITQDEQGHVTGMTGVVAGAIPKQNLYEAILAIPDSYFPIPKDTVLAVLDASVDQDIDLDGDGEYDASSVGFVFSTVPHPAENLTQHTP